MKGNPWAFAIVFLFVAVGSKESYGFLLQHFGDSNSYQPSAFVKDDRIHRIKDAAKVIQQLFKKHAITNKIPGIAYGIVIDDSLVITSVKGVANLDEELPVTRNSCFRIASMTKSFTAMAILKLRDAGKLTLQDPAAKYIPELVSFKSM